MRASGPTRVVRPMPAILWVIAFCFAAALGFWRYHLLEWVSPASPLGAGGDFWGFLHAARQISSHQEIYSVAQVAKGYGYVYSPLVAVVLVPVAGAATLGVWHVWTALTIVAMVSFGGLVVYAENQNSNAWRLPVLFGFTTATALIFLPTESELTNGQTDAFVLVLLAATVVTTKRERTTASGVLLGVAGLVKTWPAAAALALFQRGYAGRRQAIVGFVATLLVGPVLAAVIGGGQGLAGFFKVTFAARSQQLVSFSVWTTPRLLFATTGLVHPLVVSTVLLAAATLVLAAWVIGLLGATIRGTNYSSLGFWNVTACVVLLLPVSHYFYSLYLLPLLWIWATRWLASGRFQAAEGIIAGSLLAWWLALFHVDWSGGSAGQSAVRVAVVFFADLAAVTVSVLGDYMLTAKVSDADTAVESRPARHRRPAPRHALASHQRHW